MAQAGMAMKAALANVSDRVAEKISCPVLQEEASSWIRLQYH